MGAQHRRDGDDAMVDHLPQPVGKGPFAEKSERINAWGDEGYDDVTAENRLSESCAGGSPWLSASHGDDLVSLSTNVSHAASRRENFAGQ